MCLEVRGAPGEDGTPDLLLIFDLHIPVLPHLIKLHLQPLLTLFVNAHIESNFGSSRATASISKFVAMLDSAFEGAWIFYKVTTFAFVEKLGKVSCLEGLEVCLVFDSTSLIGNYSL